MYLSKIEIAGFKSFAVKTSLPLSDGLIAIVGPNGCGKTNIVDAVRWALGEQKTSVLRSDIMENVIFNGSKSRKQLGMAEVSLTIENNKHILPLEYNQIMITRRLFRNGESQYLLNKTQCRLRDILDLFMDTGMGANAYSVIELKMIESILSERAQERRTLFEEAAGITKYKSRRKEALRKLDNVQQDLARVNDIVVEVQKNVASLGRQADKARLFNEASEKLRIVDIELMRCEYSRIFSGIESKEQEFAVLCKQREDLHIHIERCDGELDGLERQQQSALQQLQQASEKEAALAHSLARIQQTLAVNEERERALHSSQERISLEEQDASRSYSHLLETLKSAQDQCQALKEELAKAVAASQATKQKRDSAYNAVQTLRSDFRNFEQKSERLAKELTEKQTQKERVSERIAGLERRMAESLREKIAFSETLTAIEATFKAEMQKLNIFDQALKEAEQAQLQAQQRQSDLRLLLDEKQHTLSDIRGEAAKKSAALEFLSSLADGAESSKFLLSSKEWQIAGEKATLSELIVVDELYRVALEAALGEAGRWFVVANREEAEGAIQLLKDKDKGKATFLCRSQIPSVSGPSNPLPKTNGVAGWASEIASADDDDLVHALRFILDGIVVADTLENARRCLSVSPSISSVVTLRGEIVSKTGILRGGALSRTEGMAVGKKQQIATLTRDAEQLRNNQAVLEAEIADVRNELQGIDLRIFNERVRKTQLEKSAFEQSLAALRSRKESSEAAIAKNEERRKGFALEEETAKQQIEDLQRDVESKKHEFEALHALKLKCAESGQQAEQALLAEEDLHRRAELHTVHLQGEERSYLNDIQRLESQKHAAERRTDHRGQEHGAASIALKDLADLLAKTKVELEEASAAHNAAKQEKSLCSQNVESLRKQFHDLSEESRSARLQYERLTAETHKRELHLNEVKSALHAIHARAVADYGVSDEELGQPNNVDFSEEQFRADSEKLRSRLKSYGNVNFLALEEHEKERTRFEFLQEQYNDLLSSEKTLKETIEEINGTATELFNETFEKVRVNFKSLFAMLFNEQGEADLSLQEGDPLEAPIAITAKPPGKRPQSIELLSAGEKTLTAIALLFAIYLVKPSPFCILDEVDAPLDDVNIDRYLNLIRQFSLNTQFLIITHNKKTMEAADILFGVTQEEQGVSRVVSVHFSGESAAAAV